MKIPQLRAGLSTIVSQYLILAGTFFVLPLYLQLVLGKNALERTGPRVTATPSGRAMASLLPEALASRYLNRREARQHDHKEGNADD